MKLETYLDAMLHAYQEWSYYADVLPHSVYNNRKKRQYFKFKQHILNHAIWYQNKEVPYYIHEMASLIKKPPVRKPEKRKKKVKFDGAGLS